MALLLDASGRGRVPKASDMIVTAVRSRIARDKLAVGTRLPSEAELSEEFGLGRVTVREALRILERDGLIDIRRGPNGGIFVRHADIGRVSEALALLFNMRDTTLGEFGEFRIFLEPKVAGLAALNASDAQRSDLLAIANIGGARNTPSVEFHDLIAESCGNGVFELALKSMRASLTRHFRDDQIGEQDREETALAHQKIAQRIADGNIAGAERAMARHLEGYMAYLRDHKLDKEPIVPLNQL